MYDKEVNNMQDKEMFMLSSRTNPWNYFANFDEWLAYERFTGSNSCELLARFVHTDVDMSEEEENAEISRAINYILINIDILHEYCKQYPPTAANA